MSLIKFELKKEHLMLLKNLEWSKTETNHILSINSLDNDDVEEVILTPFGGDNLIQDIGLIIYGRAEGEDIVPKMNDEDGRDSIVQSYTEEQISEMTELFNGLVTALDICLYTQSFETGHYKRKYHERHWVKYEPK
jgi:hypothetical protein